MPRPQAVRCLRVCTTSDRRPWILDEKVTRWCGPTRIRAAFASLQNIDPHMDASTLPEGASAPLSAVIATDELFRRPSRLPDCEAENRALVALAQALSDSPTGILQKLVDASLALCRGHSAGISLLDEQEGRQVFRWPAVAGQWASHVGGLASRRGTRSAIAQRRTGATVTITGRYVPRISGPFAHGS